MGVVGKPGTVVQPQVGHRRADQRVAVPEVVALPEAGDPLHVVGRPLPDAFPNTKRYAAELTSGAALDRFAFTLTLIVGGLNARG